jgi:molybdenum cofactor cytidylyltransferase
MIDVALEVARPVVVVLGANKQVIHKALHKNVLFAINHNWSSGMASSIHCGLSILLRSAPGAEAALIMVCDQPFVTPGLLKEIFAQHQTTAKNVVACRYGNTIGVPALFHRSLFTQLLALEGDEGARKLIKQHKDELAIVSFPKGDIDIDTIDDWNKWQKDNNL